jgi:hypothetical protein
MTVTKKVKGVTFNITKAPANTDKKLKATYTNKQTGKENTILFGAKGYEHYKDKTGLLDPKLNHEDKKRRDNYRSRHKNDNLNKPSAGLLSWHLLW